MTEPDIIIILGRLIISKSITLDVQSKDFNSQIQEIILV
jgi:hypothetical protein